MRTAFLLQRLFGYITVFCGLLASGHALVWWQWMVSAFVIAWGSLDQWKRPDASETVMRKGIIAEMLLIATWAVLLHDAGALLFMLVSPVARGCVHLKPLEASWFGGLSLAALIGLHALYPTSLLATVLQVVSFVAMGTYSAVLGALLRQRDQLRRIVIVDTFDREQRAKDDERIRLAAQLHDTVGQYWTAVIRALDVAVAVDGEQREVFLRKAREAATLGLRETRNSVHDWNMGGQSASSWMEFAEASLQRIQSLAGIRLEQNIIPLTWHEFSDSDKVGELVARTLLESVTNAIRHGAAHAVWISMQQDEDALQVIVRDDGTGFNQKQTDSSTGIGMKNLANAACGMGGSLRVDSANRLGTAVILRLPKTASLVQRGERA